MVVRRQKKIRRQRGGRSHGWGIQKDHKGHGMKGGFGGAGLMTHRYIQVVKREQAGEKLIGKYGFKRPQIRQTTDSTINVSHLDQSIDTLVKKGKATQRGATYTVNLAELGYDKLLSQGAVTRKINVTVESATESAGKKIRKAGGKVILLSEAESEEA